MKRFPLSLVAALFWILLIVFAGFVFTLPVFPSGDGPVHVYYADVLADRLAGGDTYEDFGVRQYLPPYALINYYLAITGSLVPPHFAEKILVCLCVLILCLGFRRLVMRLAGGETALVLLIFPFAYYRYLFTGFYNFCFGVGLALFAIEYWLRIKGDVSRKSAVRFAVLVFTLYFAHPLALAVVISVIGLDICISILFTPASSDGGILSTLGTSLRANRHQLGLLAIALAPALYIIFFVSGGGSIQFEIGWEGIRKWTPVFWKMERIQPYLTEVGQLARRFAAAAGVTLAMVGVTLGRKEAGYRNRVMLTLSGICFFVVYCWVPGLVGGAAFVGERFAYIGLVLILAAAASTPIRFHRSAGVASVLFVLSLAVFWQDARFTTLLAEMNRVLVEAPAGNGGAGAILLEGGWERDHYPDTSFSPCLWAAAHYFRRSRMTLLNAPWVGLPFWMLHVQHYQPYFGHEPPHMPLYLADALDGKENRTLPDNIDLLVGVDCAAGEPDHTVIERLGAHYGLTRMPWSTREYVFYARPAGLK